MRALLAALALALPTAPPQAGYLDAVNDLRADAGLAPLVLDAELSAYADWWAEHLAATNSWGHSPALGSATDDWVLIGENVGAGLSLEAVVVEWQRSPSHYANIVEPAFDRIGIGLADGPDRHYVVHVFVDSAPVPPPPPEPPPPPPRHPAVERVAALLLRLRDGVA